MIDIKGMNITVSRGDCSPFTITLTGEDEVPDGTKVLFTVKKSSGHKEPVIEKTLTVENRIVTIRIMNADTKDLPFGDYEWDIRLPDWFGENEPWTPMERPEKFTVARVIGNVG